MNLGHLKQNTSLSQGSNNYLHSTRVTNTNRQFNLRNPYRKSSLIRDDAKEFNSSYRQTVVGNDSCSSYLINNHLLQNDMNQFNELTIDT